MDIQNRGRRLQLDKQRSCSVIPKMIMEAAAVLLIAIGLLVLQLWAVLAILQTLLDSGL